MSGFRCLALETSVSAPSVAACNGERQCELWLPGGKEVAAALFEAIGRALAEVDLALEGLDCIAFGRGPGAFTGLRVAAAAAQGLGTGLGVKLCPVSSLAALAQDAYERMGAKAPGLREGRDALSPGERAGTKPSRFRGGRDRRESSALSPGVRIAPCLPAGRDQLYMGWYQAEASGLVAPRAEDRLEDAEACRVPGSSPFIAAGAGWTHAPALQERHSPRVIARQEEALPRARAVLRLARREHAEGRLLEPEEAQPVYLRSAV